MHESSQWEDSVFVTLTYDDDNIQDISKPELQKFFKRLRADLAPRKIKYYACGEYGDRTGRPHYHAIIFGISIPEKTIIEQNWTKGLVHVGTVTPHSCRYVASYIQKKLYKQPGERNSSLFSLQSQGLGLSWADNNRAYLARHQHLTINGVKHGIPRYYVKKLELDLSESSKMRSEKRDDEYRERLQAAEQSDTSDLYEINLHSKAQKERNVLAKSAQKEKRL